MSAVYTKRLLSVNLAGGAAASAIVPAGKTWVVRNIIAVCDGQTSKSTAALYAPFPLTIAIAEQAANTNSVFTADTRVVLLPGEELRAIAVVNGVWHITCTGYEFIL